MVFDAPFPLALPLVSGCYLSLLVLTLVVHVVFMNYVLAGSVLLVAGVHRPADTPMGRLAAVLGDWLPAALGLTITAGVAPLLFVQIGYQEAFFTANLLAFHRWMAILPVLIVAFYLLYAIKITGTRRPRRALWCAVGASLCFGFVALSWSENTVLAGAGREAWHRVYADGRWFYRDALLWPRLGLWVVGSVPTCASLLLLQLGDAADPATGAARRRLAQVALGGMLGATVLLAVNGWLVEETTRANVLGANRVWLVVGGLAWLGLGVQWVAVARGGGSRRSRRWLLGITTLVAILSATVLREVARLSGLDLAELVPAHERAAGKGGLVVFLACAVVNFGLIAWIVRGVRRALRERADLNGSP